MAGSVPMLAGFMLIFVKMGTLDFQALAALGAGGGVASALGSHAWWVFGLIVLAMAVKVGLWPLHIWLPDAYRSAPDGVTILLSGLLSKMGLYGLLRLALPLFPEQAAAASTFLVGWAALSVLASAVTAAGQTDLKRVLAYLSMSHVVLCVFGIFAACAVAADKDPARLAILQGVVFQMFNHAINSAGLFFVAGILAAKMGGYEIGGQGGLRQTAPVLAGLWSLLVFASCGLPPLGGFVSEFLILSGAWVLQPWWSLLAVVTLVLTVAYMLKFTHALFWGPQSAVSKGASDLRPWEGIRAVLLGVLVVGAGLMPRFWMSLSEATMTLIAGRF